MSTTVDAATDNAPDLAMPMALDTAGLTYKIAYRGKVIKVAGASR
ncbi:hypothetical protein AB0B30_20955 [Streptomyces narbonensis]|uniref:Uncharacterized protein n=1 Tax=Streptomyces narbonensis TaxID=67333 RepID=A0ABV3C8H6_9ACTN